MKRIIAVNCSPRSICNTATLVREAAKGAEAQGKDYSHYSWTMFNPAHKMERHVKEFPEDKKKAFALGEQMITGAWAEGC